MFIILHIISKYLAVVYMLNPPLFFAPIHYIWYIQKIIYYVHTSHVLPLCYKQCDKCETSTVGIVL